MEVQFRPWLSHSYDILLYGYFLGWSLLLHLTKQKPKWSLYFKHYLLPWYQLWEPMECSYQFWIFVDLLYIKLTWLCSLSNIDLMDSCIRVFTMR